jgi:hypothetical protein
LGVLFFAASRLDKSRRKPSLKFLLNCGTPNLSREGSDYGSEDSAKVDPDWQYSSDRIESSAKRLKVQQHEGIKALFPEKPSDVIWHHLMHLQDILSSFLMHWNH